MKRVTFVGMLAALCVGTAAPAAFAAPLTLQFRMITTSQHFVDNPPAATSPDNGLPGDQYLFTERATSRGRTVGRDAGVCTVVTAAQALCDVTIVVFGRGTVSLHGLASQTAPSTVSVVGGTGQFAGRRGTAQIRDAGSDRTLITIRLL